MAIVIKLGPNQVNKQVLSRARELYINKQEEARFLRETEDFAVSSRQLDEKDVCSQRDAFAAAAEKGEMRGLERGREEGKKEEKKEQIQRRLKRGHPAQEIAEDMGLDLQEIEAIRKLLI